MEDERVVVSSIDEFLEHVRRDEAVDQATVQSKMCINDYARARGIAPQLVHYKCRTGKLKKEQCACGRKVIDIAAADQAFGFNQEHSLEVKYASAEEEDEDRADA